MLRPERMSKVSVTGSKAVMETVIETTHRLHALDLSDYDGSWQGFDNGDPIEGADEASEKLVTVRALESTLDLEAFDVDGDGRLEDGWEERLERIRTEVNDLDDRRGDLREELRRVEERLDRVAPFAELGVDLDLLSGYDSIEVVVGEGPLDEIEAALSASDDVRAFETFGDDVFAVAAAPATGADGDVVDDALVGIEFTRHEVPETDRSPAAYVDDLEDRRRDLEADLEEVDRDLERLAREEGGFLLRVEEELTIEVQRAEAPLRFATTERAFVAEGWIPTGVYDELVAALRDAVGDSVEIEELVRADYDEDGYPTGSETVAGRQPGAADEEGDDEADAEAPAAVADGGAPASAGGRNVVTMADEPPVVQDNATPAKPFEFLLKMIDRPKYSELDPTMFLLLTFPAFFGFMIGDLGYGLLYGIAGYLLYSRFDDDAIRSLGAIGIWVGGFTALFGVLYGEVFGMHVLGEVVFGGDPPMHKGLQPAFGMYAQTWLMASVLLGLAHLTTGYVLGFVNDLDHGVADAYFEKGSWALLMLGLWIWIFSRHGVGPAPDFEGPKPSFLYTALGDGPEAAYALGFNGLPETVGLAGVGIGAIGLVTMIYGEIRHYGPVIGTIIGALESFSVLGDVLSYLRIAAVILAKAGMAFVVNMLFFGVYVTGETGNEVWHFGTSHAPQYYAENGYHGEAATVMFDGLLHGGLISAIAGLVILVVGHVVVLLLGITSAGLQGIRLEYVEFFDKFYEGGGRPYNPFGYERESGGD